MARATLSALLTNLSGRYGGGVFRNWKGLIVLGVLPESVRNPSTARQVNARNALAVISKKWTTLTATARGQWESVGAYLTSQWENYSNEVGVRTVIKEPRGPFGGLTALSYVHCLLASTEDWTPSGALKDAPVGVTAPSSPTSFSASGDTDGIDVVIGAPASWGDNATAGKVRVWAMSEDGTFFAQLAVYGADGPLTITTLRAAGSGLALPLTPGWYFLQSDAVNAEGLRGMPSQVLTIEIAAPV
jgi:hypothetical protein